MTAYDKVTLDFAKWIFEMYGKATLCDGDNLSAKCFSDYADGD